MAERINQEQFAQKVLENDNPVLVEFYSDSCIPCKQLSPILGEQIGRASCRERV